MALIQRSHPCDEHEDCLIIGLYGGPELVAERGFSRPAPYGEMVWQSHAHKSLHIECRIADDGPPCHDGQKPIKARVGQCDDCQKKAMA